MHCPRISALAFSTCLLAATTAVGGWDPVDPAYLQVKSPQVEKDADAEYLLWEVRIEDSAVDDRSHWSYHAVIKVFTERGRDQFSTVDLDYYSGTRIGDIVGRTIKPDGRTLELSSDAVFDKTKVKGERTTLKCKSFALPKVEPGDIVEYRWVEHRPIAHYKRIHFQQSVPVRLARCRVSPLEGEGLRTRAFNITVSPFRKEKGLQTTTVENIPAFKEEAFMPPEDQVRGWMLLFYSNEYNLEPGKYWRDLGRQLYAELKPLLSPNDELRRMAASLTAGVTAEDEKIARLYEFCRSGITNAYHDSAGFTDDQREMLNKNNSPADTLKRRVGTGPDILLLFAALANASGFDARLARVSDRSDFFFDPAFPDDYFLGAWDVAIKRGEGWRFYDPSSPYLPLGMLGWWEEGIQALVTDPENPVFVAVPISGPEKSQRLRTAELRLGEDGTLEGEVKVEYTGQLAASAKNVLDDKSPAQREEWVKDPYKKRLGAAELTNVVVAEPKEFSKPFVFSYHVRLPGFAQKTGKRLFFQPSFFEVNNPVPFDVAERRNAVYFQFPWSEDDNVTIQLPEGYELENAEAPAPASAGKVSACNVKLFYRPESRSLQLRRGFFFGGASTILFQTRDYGALKTLFEAYHAMDNHTLTLKATPAGGAAGR